MTDDQILRIIIVGGTIAVVGVFKPQIMGWLRKIGYRDWRHDDASPPQHRYTADEILVIAVAGVLAVLCLFVFGAAVVASILRRDVNQLGWAVGAALILVPCWIVIAAIFKRARNR